MKPFIVDAFSIENNVATCKFTNQNNLKIQFLTNSLARVTYLPAAGFKEPKTWAIAPLPAINYNCQHNNINVADVAWQGRNRESIEGFLPPTVKVNGNEICSEKISVNINTSPLQLIWRDNNSKTTILADRFTTAYMADNRNGKIRHYLQREEGERFYGLGDKTGELDLNCRRLRTFAMDSLSFHPQKGDPLYKHWPFVLSRNINGKWIGIYYDTLAECTFDFGCEHDNYHGFYRYVEIDDGDLDYYIMFGDSPAEVIQQWLQLIGGTALPPKWTVGFAQTAMGLADAADAQHQLDLFIDKVIEHQVPISSFHYGSGYSSIGKKRYVFTWNNDKFPDPKKLNKKFQEQGMHLVANIKPCLLDDHPAFAEVEKFGGFIHQEQDKKPILEPFWDGAGAHLDFTNPQTINWWQENLEKQVLEYGIDVGWNDNNEYGILDEDAQCNYFGKAMPIHRVRPLHPLLMTRATFEKQQAFLDKNKLSENNFTVTRAGAPGIQRYAQTWSGDNTTNWENLRWNIRTGLQMSISGMFNVGHDVGGFYGPLPTPELFVRWVQATCLNPRMVMNSWKEGGVSNVPWMYPEVIPEVLSAIKLRYSLMPYLWQLFGLAHKKQEPIIRPTFYDFYNDEECYKDCDDFMLGANLLVAPVVFANQINRKVYLPKIEGGDNYWRDFYTNEKYTGGKYHTVLAPLAKLPLFICGNTKIL